MRRRQGAKRRGRRVSAGLGLLLLAALGVGAQRPETGAAAAPPLGLPPLAAPTDNPTTADKVELGRLLFFDRRLSSDGTVSCADCHRPEHAFSDPRPVSQGVAGQHSVRHAPSILNSGYFPHLLWDGRANGLEDQVRYPVTDPREMNMTQRRVEEVLAAVPDYPPRFAAAFGDPAVTFERVSHAVAAFERTLLSGGSPFDRFFFGGDKGALPPAARRGWELFRGKAGCVECHRFDAAGPFFTDFEFHNTGVGFEAREPDLGRYRVTREREDKGRFRTPSLRNVSLTPPYMHDGSLADLEQVVAFYARGGTPNPFLDERIRPQALTPKETADLVAFLSSLAGNGSGAAAATAGGGR